MKNNEKRERKIETRIQRHLEKKKSPNYHINRKIKMAHIHDKGSDIQGVEML